MKATGIANTNIALIKYWGKRDEKLFLPMNSSLSITLDGFYTITTVEFKKDIERDIFYLNNQNIIGSEYSKVSKFMDYVRDISGSNLYAEIASENRVPTAAGLASSASGFAALSAAVNKALDLGFDKRQISMLARRGSGSACRSVFGGFVEWQKGTKEDGSDSFANQLLDENDWEISILSVMIASKPKKISSREGMKRVLETSPFYQGWLDTVEKDLHEAKDAINSKDFERLGMVAEVNALKMHATMLGAVPPIMYWQSGTIEVMEHIEKLRDSGIPAYFTIDAGPNVKVLCLPKHENMLKESILDLPSVKSVVNCRPGSGITCL